MIATAPWLAWPGYEAFLVWYDQGPSYLIQVERKELASKLHAGKSLHEIVTGECN